MGIFARFGELREQYHLPLALIFILMPMLFSLISASRRCAAALNGHRIRRRIHSGMVIGPPRYFIPMAFSASAIAAVYAYSFARRLYLRDMSDTEDVYTEEDELFGRRDRKDRQPDGKVPNATIITVLLVPLALWLPCLRDWSSRKTRTVYA